jgi:lysophospholipase L1-like esterase
MRRSACFVLVVTLVAAAPVACSEDENAGDDTGVSGAGSAGSGAAGSAGNASGATGGAGGTDTSGTSAGGTDTEGGDGGSTAAGRGGAGGSAGGPLGGTGGTSGSFAGTGTGGTDRPVEIEPCPTNGGPCRILPLGDSITDGYNVPGGYRMKLFSLANADDHLVTFVGAETNGPDEVDGAQFPKNHEGHPGWKVAQLLDRIPAPAFDVTPHIVLLMAGTNDVISGDNLTEASVQLGNVIDQVVMAAPQALVVVARITPLAGDNNARVMAYNDLLPGVVQAKADAGKPVILVDQFTGFPMEEIADRVHPNQAGYDRMGGVWYAAIENLLP